MRLCSIVLATAFLVVGFASAQDQSVGKREIGEGRTAILTQSECADVFTKLENTASRLAGTPISLGAMPRADVPVKRSEIIARFDKIVDVCKPKFQFTPRRTSFDPQTLGLPVGHPQRVALERLVKWGFVARTMPFALSKSESVTAFDLGDAVGLFLLRLADVTHRPDQKFSPIISGGG